MYFRTNTVLNIPQVIFNQQIVIILKSMQHFRPWMKSKELTIVYSLQWSYKCFKIFLVATCRTSILSLQNQEPIRLTVNLYFNTVVYKIITIHRFLLHFFQSLFFTVTDTFPVYCEKIIHNISHSFSYKLCVSCIIKFIIISNFAGLINDQKLSWKTYIEIQNIHSSEDVTTIILFPKFQQRIFNDVWKIKICSISLYHFLVRMRSHNVKITR